MLFSVSNSLNKWLKTDIPRLPDEEGQRIGVHALASDQQIFCWQLHIIDNAPSACGSRSRHKTIIACEANSRFIVFIPVDAKLTLDELAARLQMEWQYSLAETLKQLRAIPSSDIAMFLSELSELNMDIHWVKNTDLSISGHISDAALWVTQMLEEQGLNELPSDLCTDLSIHINTEKKRAKNQKQKFMPMVKMMDYCKDILLAEDNGKPLHQNETTNDALFSQQPDEMSQAACNIIDFNQYKQSKR